MSFRFVEYQRQWSHVFFMLRTETCRCPSIVSRLSHRQNRCINLLSKHLIITHDEQREQCTELITNCLRLATQVTLKQDFYPNKYIDRCRRQYQWVFRRCNAFCCIPHRCCAWFLLLWLNITLVVIYLFIDINLSVKSVRVSELELINKDLCLNIGYSMWCSIYGAMFYWYSSSVARKSFE